MPGEPLSGGLKILPMMALSGYAGETDIVAEFADKTRFVFPQVIQDVLHVARLKQKAAKGKRERQATRAFRQQILLGHVTIRSLLLAQKV